MTTRPITYNNAIVKIIMCSYVWFHRLIKWHICRRGKCNLRALLYWDTKLFFLQVCNSMRTDVFRLAVEQKLILWTWAFRSSSMNGWTLIVAHFFVAPYSVDTPSWEWITQDTSIIWITELRSNKINRFSYIATESAIYLLGAFRATLNTYFAR